MDKQPKGLVTYVSTSRQLLPTLIVMGTLPDDEYIKRCTPRKIQLQFREHTFRTRIAKVIKAADDKIQEWKDRGLIPLFMRIDEAELMKIKKPEKVAIEGKDGLEMVETDKLEDAWKLYQEQMRNVKIEDKTPTVITGNKGTAGITTNSETDKK